jgi:hypothetical protein
MLLALRGSGMEKWLCLGALGVAGLLLLLFLLDMIVGFPFGGGAFFFADILGLLAAGILGYLGWNAYVDVR